MKIGLLVGLTVALLATSAVAQEAMPDTQKSRFCQRVSDFAVRAFFDREKGRPMLHFDEDGSDGARVTNAIVRRIYDTPQISSPKKAAAFSLGTCNEMVGAPRGAE